MPRARDDTPGADGRAVSGGRADPGRRRAWAGAALWLAWTAAVAAAALLPAADELAWPRVSAPPLPAIAAIEGLTLPPSADLPAIAAARAWPDDGPGPLAIAGLPRGLALEAVEVAVAPGWTLAARRGRLATGTLELGPDVRLHRAGDPTPRLQTAAATLTAGQLHFPGLVRLGIGAAAEDRRALRIDVDALLARLR